MTGNGMRGWAAVTGVAERKPTRWTDGETTIDMTAKIGAQAIADAGLELSDIDGLVCHPMGGVPMLVPSTIGEAMGLHLAYAATVDLGGATGAGMVWRAAAAIHAGQARAVLCVTAAWYSMLHMPNTFVTAADTSSAAGASTPEVGPAAAAFAALIAEPIRSTFAATAAMDSGSVIRNAIVPSSTIERFRSNRGLAAAGHCQSGPSSA